MAELSAGDLKRLPDDQFAYIDRQGQRHLPVHDHQHVQNAVARFSKTYFESGAARKKAAQQVLAAARKQGVQVSEDDEVSRASR